MMGILGKGLKTVGLLQFGILQFSKMNLAPLENFLYEMADSAQSVNVGNVASVCFTTLKMKLGKSMNNFWII